MISDIVFIHFTSIRRHLSVIVSFQFKSIFKDMGGSRAGGGGEGGGAGPHHEKSQN